MRRRTRNRPDPDPDPETPSKTLDLVDLVWAKTARSQPWWPARVLAHSPPGHLIISRFGTASTTQSCLISQVKLKPFFNANIDDMISCGGQSGAFLTAFCEAIRFASLCLQSQLTCRCVPLEARPANVARSIGIGNFSGREVVECVRDVALSVWAVDVVDSVKLKGWVFALAQGMCNGEVGFNRRRLVGDLVDKFDLDLDACAEDDVMDGNMGLQDDLTDGGMGMAEVSKPTRKRKRVRQSDEGLERESTGAGAGGTSKFEEAVASGRRERKKSKYLSPPYTNDVGSKGCKQSEEELDDEKPGEAGDGADKGNTVDLETFSVQGIFNGFLFTCLDPFYLKRKRSAKVFRSFFDKYRDTVFVDGTMHKSYKNCKCQMKRIVNIEPDLDNGQALSSEICLNPTIDRSDLTTGPGTCRVNKEPGREKGKEKFDDGACQPKKCSNPQNGVNCQSSFGSNTPNVDKSELTIERKNLTSPVSSVPLKADISIGGNKDLTSPVSSVLLKADVRIGGNKDLTSPVSSVPLKTDIGIGRNKDLTSPVSSVPLKADIRIGGNKDLKSPVSSVPLQADNGIGGNKDLTSPVSSVPLQADISIGGNTVLNFAKKPYEFLEEARAQMMQTGSPKNGNKPAAETGKQFQEQGSLNKRKTGNGDSICVAEPKQRDKKQKAAQTHYPNPAALILDFSKPNVANGTGMGADLPSRDQLLSTFSKFGMLVETQSDVHRDLQTARVVFERSTDAEAAFNSSEKLGPFGPPFASCSLQYLPPISTNPTPQNQQLSNKPQLSVMRKNLEMMISSLTGASALPMNGESSSTLNGVGPTSRGRLLEQMQGLLMKVEEKLSGSSASSSAIVPGAPLP